jgi:hypothetical protein
VTGGEERDPAKVYLVSIHPVGDFARWKAEVDQAELALARLGVTRHWMYRGADDPNDVMTVLELPSLAHAERLMRSPSADVPGWMERSGLEIYPTFFVGEQTEVHEYPVPPRGEDPA